jgi:hypothetical protein
VEPDPHHFGNLDLDPDPHVGKKPDPDPHQTKITASKGNADPDPHKPFRVKKLILYKLFIEKSIKLPLWPDPNPHKKQDLHPDPHQSEKLDPDSHPHQIKPGSGSASGSASNKNRDPDPHRSDKLDPDPHLDPQGDADSQLCLKG